MARDPARSGGVFGGRAGKAVTAIVNSRGRIVAGTDATAERLSGEAEFLKEIPEELGRLLEEAGG